MTANPTGRGRRILLTLLLVALGGGLWFISTQLNDIRSGSSGDGATAQLVTPQQAFESLKANAPVHRAVRLIVYDPASQPQLAITHLESIGPPKQEFVFVADYDQLRGYTVAKAINMVGQLCPAGSNVSAIIFPVDEEDIFPAGARGMLQVVQALDERHGNETASADGPYRRADLQSLLTPEAIAALATRDRPAGEWNSYRRFYPEYAAAVEKLLKVEHASAFDYIGSIDSDWSPVGYAQFRGRNDPPTPTQYLSLSDKSGGERVEVPDFGARVFLTPNRKLADLKGQWLIDFDQPNTQRLPVID